MLKEEKKLQDSLWNLGQEMEEMKKKNDELVERYMNPSQSCLIVFSINEKYRDQLRSSENRLEANKEELERARIAKEVLEEERVKLERKIEKLNDSAEVREREFNTELKSLFELMKMKTEENDRLEKEVKKLYKNLRDLEGQTGVFQDVNQELEAKNMEYKHLYEESCQEKEKIKHNLREYLDQSNDIQKKEEEILHFRIREQEHLAKVAWFNEKQFKRYRSKRWRCSSRDTRLTSKKAGFRAGRVGRLRH